MCEDLACRLPKYSWQSLHWNLLRLDLGVFAKAFSMVATNRSNLIARSWDGTQLHKSSCTRNAYRTVAISDAASMIREGCFGAVNFGSNIAATGPSHSHFHVGLLESLATHLYFCPCGRARAQPAAYDHGTERIDLEVCRARSRKPSRGHRHLVISPVFTLSGSDLC